MALVSVGILRFLCPIELSAEADRGEAVVRVRDTGIGIPSHVIPDLFAPFYQVDRSLNRAKGGLRLGLTVVRALAEMHGGALSAHSEGPDQGSELTVRLPMAK